MAHFDMSFFFQGLLKDVFSFITHAKKMQSKRNAEVGMINAARKQGMIAAYLSVAAIVSALVVACLATGLAVGLVYYDY